MSNKCNKDDDGMTSTADDMPPNTDVKRCKYEDKYDEDDDDNDNDNDNNNEGLDE